MLVPMGGRQDAVSIFAYKDERVSKMIWHIKYKKSEKATAIAGYAISQKLIEIGSSDNRSLSDIIIIPMPITTRRRLERGYNQCELIVDRVKSYLDVSRCDLALTRIHHSSRQTLKNRTDRLKNAKGIFYADPKYIDQYKDATVIIIDDVITTGSTMKEALETLRAAGYRDVRGLSVAH